MSSLVATSALLFLSSLCYCALTKSITIRNAGFETDGPLPMRTYQYGGTIITDWTEYDPEGLIDGSVGIANALGSTIFNDSVFNALPPQGNVFGYVEQVHNDWRRQGEIGIHQKLSEVVTANTIYTLKVYVGHPGNGCWSKSSTDGAVCQNYVGFPGYRVQLMAGNNNILTEDDDTLNIDQRQWMQSVVTVSIAPRNIHLGKQLKIMLIDKNLAGGYVAFDDVRLDTRSPTQAPTRSPSPFATQQPTRSPTWNPIRTPTRSPTRDPTDHPMDDHGSITNPTHTPTPQNVIIYTQMKPTPKPSQQKHMSPQSTQNEFALMTVSVVILVVCVICCIFCIIGVINVRKIRLSMVIANDSEDEQEGREKQQCIGCWCWKYNEELFALDGLLYCEKCREHYDNGSNSMMEEHTMKQETN
eukprot:278635_1